MRFEHYIELEKSDITGPTKEFIREEDGLYLYKDLLFNRTFRSTIPPKPEEMPKKNYESELKDIEQKMERNHQEMMDIMKTASSDPGKSAELKDRLDKLFNENLKMGTQKAEIKNQQAMQKPVAPVTPARQESGLPKKKVLHPGLRGSTNWYINEKGEVVYGDRPQGVPTVTPLTENEIKFKPSFKTMLSVPDMDKKIIEFSADKLNESQQKALIMMYELFKIPHEEMKEKLDVTINARRIMKELGISDVRYEANEGSSGYYRLNNRELGGMRHAELLELRENLKEELGKILNDDPNLKRFLINKAQENKAAADKKRAELMAKMELDKKEREEQEKREEESRIAALSPEERARIEAEQKRDEANRARMQREKEEKDKELRSGMGEGAANTALIQDVINGNVTEENVLKCISILKNSGVLRMMRRGENKGQLQIDMKMLNDIKYRMDKDEVTALPLFLGTGIYDDYNKMIADVSKEERFRREGKLKSYVQGNDMFYEEMLGASKKSYDKTMKEWSKEQGMALNGLLEKVCIEITAYNKSESRKLDMIASRTEKTEVEGVDIVQAIADNEKARHNMLAAQKNSNYTLPENFNKEKMRAGDLDNYQKQGVNWIMEAKRGVLAFDMGLGKTLTTIAAGAELLNRKEVPRVIIYAPVSLMYQWKEEVEKWTSGYKAAVIMGTPDERAKQLRKAEKNAQFVIVSYGNLINDKESKIMANMEGATFFDEGKVFGSPETKSYKHAKEILKNKKYAINLTATPIPNWAEDLYHMVDLFRPHSIGTLAKFKNDFELVKKDAKDNVRVIGQKNSEKLHKLVEPLVFFKNKFDKDVDIVMPELQSIPKIYEMAEDHNEYYAAAQADALKEFLDVKNPDNLMPQEIGNILARLSYLRRVAISPALVDQKYEGSAPKIDQAVEEVVTHTMNNPGHPIVITSEFKEAFPVIKKRLMQDHGFKESEISELTGDTPPEEREQIKQTTNAGQNKVLLLSMKAGGYGLNLQGAANKMVFVHDPWTHTTKEQTIARIYRPGQQNKVTIMHQKMKGSIDGYMEELLRKKKEAAMAVERGQEGITQSRMSFDDMLSLIGVTRAEYDELKKGGQNR